MTLTLQLLLRPPQPDKRSGDVLALFEMTFLFLRDRTFHLTVFLADSFVCGCADVHIQHSM